MFLRRRMLVLLNCVPALCLGQGAPDIRIAGSDTAEMLVEPAVAQYKKSKPD